MRIYCYVPYAVLGFIQHTAPGVNRPRRLFVSPRNPARSISKNAISYFLREVIAEAGVSSVAGVEPRAHSIRGVAISTAFHRNWSITSVLNVACWRSSSVFTSFYLKDLFFEINGSRSLGPFVAAGVQID